MDLEEQTLRYYLSLFSVIIFLFYSYYIVHFQFLFNDKHIIKIAKGDSISKISEKIIIDKNYLQKKIYYLLIKKQTIYNIFYIERIDTSFLYFKLAPPINKPSTSLIFNSFSAFFLSTDPPYNILTFL